MKKRFVGILSALILLVALGGVTPILGAYATAEKSGEWVVQNGSAAGGKLTASGVTDMTATYSSKVNAKSGVIIKYNIDEFTLNSDIGGDESSKQSIIFDFMTDDKQSGITVAIKPVRMNLGAKKKQRMVANVGYTTGGASMGTQSNTCLWEFDTYLDVFKQQHTLSVQHSFGAYYVEADGRIFPPYRPAKDCNLDSVNLKITTHSVTAATPAKLDIISVEAQKQVISEGDWLDMGPTQKVYHNDGAVSYTNIDEQYTRDNPGIGAYWLNTRIGAVRGYDVTQPIKIQTHYDMNGAGVWWGLYMPNQPMLPMSQEKNNIDYSDNITFCKGVQFDTLPPFKARPHWYKESKPPTADEIAEKRNYSPNGAGLSYAGAQHINTIEINVGEQSSVIKFNDVVLWDDFRLTRSDYSAANGGDGKMYPLFEFIETPTSSKTVNFTIKGINIPEISSNVDITRAKNDSADLVVDVSNSNNGELRLLDSNRQPIAADKYSYNSGKFTIKAELLNALAANPSAPYNFYIANNGGMEGLHIRIVEEIVALQKAVFTPNTYALATSGSAESDLVLSVDFKNGTFKSIVGGGLSKSQYTYVAPVTGSTVGSITINKDWLNNLADGDIVLRLTTTDITNATQVTEFSIKVGSGNIDDGKNPPDKKGGCNSNANGSSIIIALLASFGLLFVVKHKKAKL